MPADIYFSLTRPIRPNPRSTRVRLPHLAMSSHLSYGCDLQYNKANGRQEPRHCAPNKPTSGQYQYLLGAAFPGLSRSSADLAGFSQASEFDALFSSRIFEAAHLNGGWVYFRRSVHT